MAMRWRQPYDVIAGVIRDVAGSGYSVGLVEHDHGDDLRFWITPDLYPGTGAVTRAWQTWRGLFVLPAATPNVAAATKGVAPEQKQEVGP